MSLQAKADSLAANASYLTNGSLAVFGALTLNQLIGLAGLGLGLLTLLFNVWMQRRRDRREQEFHERRMQVKLETEQFVTRLPDSDSTN
ncbi:hypothetical protein [Marinobacter sp. BGYM27]|uniref:hypothetical protein n=1 Tax=Marinobacter sp. BGYM27 TaxID=2975597 RepID=UPI0021A2FD76|nr:hypothetical protein [Marinobacter sp. BGYM27]MDG5498952.1 hypothetical protein [Marinobacter sp. BGYM27]